MLETIRSGRYVYAASKENKKWTDKVSHTLDNTLAKNKTQTVRQQERRERTPTLDYRRFVLELNAIIDEIYI